MNKFNKCRLNNLKNNFGLIIYFGIIGTYLFVSINQNLKWENKIDQWRKTNIRNSPTVCITKTGEKYHNCYHYFGRSHSISLIESKEEGYLPCDVCKPPILVKNSVKPIAPDYYYQHWIIMSIIFSFFYLFIYEQIKNKKN
jgi:hypothetical protein